MARKRMIDGAVFESDAFMSMPLSAHGLYVHLILHADDDGIVNNTASVIAMCGATSNDLDWLIDKEFVIDLRERYGAIVIKHWRLMNWLVADRYTPSNDEKIRKILYVKPNRMYSLDKKSGYPLCNKGKGDEKSVSTSVSDTVNGDTTEKVAQYSVVKSSVVKSSKDTDELKGSRETKPPLEPDEETKKQMEIASVEWVGKNNDD